MAKINCCTELPPPSSKRKNSVGKCIFYFYGLFNEALTSPHYMASKDKMNEELEAGVTHLSVLLQHLLGETEENHGDAPG
jgi:hypothetical protein